MMVILPNMFMNSCSYQCSFCQDYPADGEAVQACKAISGLEGGRCLTTPNAWQLCQEGAREDRDARPWMDLVATVITLPHQKGMKGQIAQCLSSRRGRQCLLWTFMRGCFLEQQRQAMRGDLTVIYYENSFYLEQPKAIICGSVAIKRNKILGSYTPKGQACRPESFLALFSCFSCPLLPIFSIISIENTRKCFLQEIGTRVSEERKCAEKYISFQNKFSYVFGFRSNNNTGSGRMISLTELSFSFSLLTSVNINLT